MTKNRTLLGCFLTASLAAPPAFAQTAAPATRPATTPPPAAAPTTKPAATPAPAAAAPALPALKPQTATPIPTAMKSAVAAPGQNVLDAAVRPDVSNLALTDAKLQSAARLRLEEGPLTGAIGQNPSAAFLTAYAATVNREVVALLKSPRGQQDWRARLNAGIVVARVAERMESFDKPGDSTVLAPAAILLADDKVAPVALWGVKAARYVAARQFDAPATPPAQSAAAAVVRAVGHFPNSDVIAEDAYDALAGQFLGVSPTNKARQGSALPHVLNLIRTRLATYTKVDLAAVAAPEDIIQQLPGYPSAESRSGLLLVATAWGGAAKPTQQQAAQLMIDLAKQADRITQPNVLLPRPPGAPEGVHKDDLTGIINQVGSVSIVVAGSNANVKAAAEAIKKINPNTPGNVVTAAIADLEAAYQAAGLLPAGGGAAAAVGAANPK